MEGQERESGEEQDAFAQWLQATGQAHLLEQADGEEGGDLFVVLFSQFAQTAEGQAEIARFQEQAREQLGVGPPQDFSVPPLVDGIDGAEERYLRSRYDEDILYAWSPELDEEGRILEVVVYEGVAGADPVEQALGRLAGLRHVRKATIDFKTYHDDAGSPQQSVSADALLPLTEWGRLEEIDIIFGEAPPEALLRLSQHNPLSELRATKMTARAGAAAIMQAHRSARRLKEVYINCEDLSDDDLQWLSDASAIDSLHFSGSRVTGTGMDALQCQGSLRTLSLDECPVSDEGLRELCRFGQLSDLSIAGPDVTDVGIRRISEMKSLRRLLLGDLPNVTNEGFASAIAGLEHLEDLALGDVPFSDEVIPAVIEMPNIRQFSILGGGQFTEAGLRKLQSIRPDCHVSAYHVLSESQD